MSMITYSSLPIFRKKGVKGLTTTYDNLKMELFEYADI